MLLPAEIQYDNNQWGVIVPKQFINHQLENGYQIGETLFCVKLKSPYNDKWLIIPVLEINNESDNLLISNSVNINLNIVDDMYIETDIIENYQQHQSYMITMKAHHESFGKLDNPRELLTQCFINMRIINVNTDILIMNELVKVTSIKTLDSLDDVDYAYCIGNDIEIHIDFETTLEADHQQQEEEKRKELEKRGFKGDGVRLSKATVNIDARAARLAWLDRLNK